MSGGPPQQPAQTTTTTPPAEAQALLATATPTIQRYIASPPPRYQGDTVTGFTPEQLQAQQTLLGGAQAAQGIADFSNQGVQGIPGQLTSQIAGQTPFAGSDIQTSSDIFNDPGIWNPQYNTGLNEAITAAQRPLYQSLTEQALPAIRTAAGPVSGTSRQGIAEGLATGRTAQAASDVGKKIVEDLYGANLGAVQNRYATNIGAENQRYGTNVGAETARYGTDINAANQRYNQNLQTELAAYGLAPSLQQQQLVAGGVQGAVGDVQQQQKQAELNAQIAAFNYDQWAPYLMAREGIQLAQGFPGGTTTSTGNVPQPNPALQATGSALGGAAIGGSLGGLPGAAIGGLGGAVLPFLFNRV